VRHIEALNSQTGPAFLVYRATPALDTIMERCTAADPDVDFTVPDQARHTAWLVDDESVIGRIVAEFTSIPHLYIADGHHRSAAAARVFQSAKAPVTVPTFSA
jgi:uncharacterized protein (DUF1015 family)